MPRVATLATTPRYAALLVMSLLLAYARHASARQHDDMLAARLRRRHAAFDAFSPATLRIDVCRLCHALIPLAHVLRQLPALCRLCCTLRAVTFTPLFFRRHADADVAAAAMMPLYCLRYYATLLTLRGCHGYVTR